MSFGRRRRGIVWGVEFLRDFSKLEVIEYIKIFITLNDISIYKDEINRIWISDLSGISTTKSFPRALYPDPIVCIPP